MITIGGTEASKIYLGSEEINKAYLGSEQIWGGTTPLPYDAQVEWIQSDGGPYIDTDIVMTKATTVDLRLMSTKTSSEAGGDNILFGAWTSNSVCSYAFVTGSNNIRVRWGNSSYQEIAVSKNDNIRFTYDGTRYYIYNQTKSTQKTSTSGTGYSTQTFRLMHGKGCRFYYAKVGNLDLIPVRVGEVGYMYDKNSGTLFGNAGTGNFTFGNDVTT